jgi:hypothetical protein
VTKSLNGFANKKTKESLQSFQHLFITIPLQISLSTINQDRSLAAYTENDKDSVLSTPAWGLSSFLSDG